jgi:hypothetical protein
MATSVLVLGKPGTIIEEVMTQLNIPDVVFHGGTGIEDVRAVLARTKIDHVVMGAGIELETRLEIVREVFLLSEATTVHLKDVASGSQGMLPFVRSVVIGLVRPH